MELNAVHLRLCVTSAVIASHLSPECPSEIFAGSHSFVSRNCSRRCWLPKLGVFTRRNDGCSPPSGNHIVASARVIRPISDDRGNFLIGRDLFQQVGQHRCVTDIACRDANRTDLQCFFIYTEMQLAPKALLWPAMLAGVPLSVTFRFDPARHCPRTNGGKCLAVDQ